jgi:hypothetical protein
LVLSLSLSLLSSHCEVNSSAPHILTHGRPLRPKAMQLAYHTLKPLKL